jgi:hypothetical protein
MVKRMHLRSLHQGFHSCWCSKRKCIFRLTTTFTENPVKTAVRADCEATDTSTCSRAYLLLLLLLWTEIDARKI